MNHFHFPYFPSIFHESKHHFPSILWGSIISKPVRHVGPQSCSLRPNPSVLFCAGAEWRDEWTKIDMGIPQAARLQGFAHICNLEIYWKSFLHRDIFLRWGGEGHSILRHPLNGNCQVPRRFLLLAVATLALMIEVERSCQCEDCWKLSRRDLRSILWYSMELPWRRNICKTSQYMSICKECNVFFSGCFTDTQSFRGHFPPYVEVVGCFGLQYFTMYRHHLWDTQPERRDSITHMDLMINNGFMDL